MLKTFKSLSYALIVFSFFMLAGCGDEFMGVQASTEISSTEISVEEKLPEKSGRSYDSYDTAVIYGFSDVNETITFYNFDLGKTYTLGYDGGTRFSDKYDTALTVSSLHVGQMCNICFMKLSKTLISLQLASECFEESEICDFNLNTNNKTLFFKDDSYRVSAKTIAFSDGEVIALQDLNESDEVTIRGIDNTVYSITVDKGHGYVRLEGEKKLVGGFIEIGKNLIYKIEEGMLMKVPEGEYPVTVSYKGNVSELSVLVDRDKETILDLSEVEINDSKYGKVLFVVTPSNATLRVDGQLIDFVSPVTLLTGMHQLSASCEEYDSIVRYFNVGEKSSELVVTLKKTGEDDSSASDSSSTSSASASDSASDSDSGSGSGSGSSSSASESGSSSSASDSDSGSGSSSSASESGSGSGSESGSGSSTSASTSEVTIDDYYIYIVCPEDADVYFDGYYVGKAPVAVTKKPGMHTITFSRKGYVTKSYTVEIDSDLKDVTLSYDDLVKE